MLVVSPECSLVKKNKVLSGVFKNVFFSAPFVERLGRFFSNIYTGNWGWNKLNNLPGV